MKTITIKIGLDEELEEHLAWMTPGYSGYHILKKSVDARKRLQPHFVYTVEVYEKGEIPQPKKIEVQKIDYKGEKPIIIGSGPGGLFAALRLVERGVPCILFEQGSECVSRMKSINRFWRYGELDPLNNVCFGEGGAGLYSDGKLITRIKSPHIEYVMNRLVQFGAPEEIEYLANPHVGSDRIRRVIPKIREFILANGGEIHFDSKVTELLYTNNLVHKSSTNNLPNEHLENSKKLKSVTGVKVKHLKTNTIKEYHSDKIILATGHSAEDILHHLDEIGVTLEGKSFAVGLRIEHPQKLINKIQFRDAAEHPKLSAANYRLAHHDKKIDVGVFSFCMCPGGYVLSSGTSEDGVVCNGMSNYKRNSPFANSAIVVSVNHEETFKNDKWGGLKFRQNLEARALQMVHTAGGKHQLPVQKLIDFLDQKKMSVSDNAKLPEFSTPSGAVATPLHELMPKNIYQQMSKGMREFEKNMRGFISEKALLYGVESRTSCPVRITRDAESLESISHSGLYPCGEGAGYAGGITSAACDGIRIAEKICESYL